MIEIFECGYWYILVPHRPEPPFPFGDRACRILRLNRSNFADVQCDFEGEVDGENIDEDRTGMNCDLDCQFEDELDEGIDVRGG